MSSCMLIRTSQDDSSQGNLMHDQDFYEQHNDTDRTTNHRTKSLNDQVFQDSNDVQPNLNLSSKILPTDRTTILPFALPDHSLTKHSNRPNSRQTKSLTDPPFQDPTDKPTNHLLQPMFHYHTQPNNRQIVGRNFLPTNQPTIRPLIHNFSGRRHYYSKQVTNTVLSYGGTCKRPSPQGRNHGGHRPRRRCQRQTTSIPQLHQRHPNEPTTPTRSTSLFPRK